jgi:preprotein translocase subunit SecD
MRRRSDWFNFYFLCFGALLTALAGGGCASSKADKEGKSEDASLFFHLEVSPDGSERNGPVTIGRAAPFQVNIEKAPFLADKHIEKVSVEDALGGFQLSVQFNQQGAWLLEQYSVAARGRRVGVSAFFPEARWLAAPVLRQRITNGVFAFTPDATREEADRIARGVNNVIKKKH